MLECVHDFIEFIKNVHLLKMKAVFNYLAELESYERRLKQYDDGSKSNRWKKKTIWYIKDQVLTDLMTNGGES